MRLPTAATLQTTTREQQALRWLDHLLDLPSAQHPPALATLRRRDAALCGRVQRLLRAAVDEHATVAVRAACDPVAAGPHQDDHAAGHRVGPYRLLRELGRGGMSQVWLAERVGSAPQRPVALKLALDCPAARWHLAHEQAVLARLPPHRHTVQPVFCGAGGDGWNGVEGAHGVRSFQGTQGTGGTTAQPAPAYLALQVVNGLPIDRWCRQARATLQERVGLVLQLLAALSHAHAHGVVHCDVKPSNILVDAAGHVTLLDFGIAWAPPGRGPGLQPAMTPRYAAPELLAGASPSPATDTYGAAAVLYELLTGCLPCGGGGDVHTLPAEMPAALLAAVHAGLPAAMPATPPSQAGFNNRLAAERGLPSAPSLRAALRGQLDRLLLTALHPAPQQRPASVDAWAHPLRQWLASGPRRTRTATAGPATANQGVTHSATAHTCAPCQSHLA